MSVALLGVVVSCSDEGGNGGAGAATSSASVSPTGTSGNGATSAQSSVTSGHTTSGSGGAGGAEPTKTVFVAGGQDLRLITSTDGKSWSNDTYVASNGLDNAITCIASGKGIIVAAGDDGVYTTRDGVAWEKSASPVGQEDMHSCASMFDGERFVIVHGRATYRSSDGMVWEKSEDPENGATHWQSIVYGNGRYLAFGDGNRMVSEDATTWHDFTYDEPHFNAVVFAEGRFVAVGDMGRHATSSDGVTWENEGYDQTLGDLYSLAYGNGVYVAMNPGRAATSTDGLTWTPQDSGVNGRVTFADGLFVGAGWYAKIAWSKDGTDFTEAFDGETPNMFDPAHTAPFFTAIGAGKVYP